MRFLRKGLVVGLALLALGASLSWPILPAGDTYTFTASADGKRHELKEPRRQTPYSVIAQRSLRKDSAVAGAGKVVHFDLIQDVPGGGMYSTSSGIGYEIAPGLVLTANHVAERGSKYYFTTWTSEDGRSGKGVFGVAVAKSPKTDLALIRYERAAGQQAQYSVMIRAAKAGEAAELRTLIPINEARDFQPASIRLTASSGGAYETLDMPVRNGMSGSPIFDKSGNLTDILLGNTEPKESRHAIGSGTGPIVEILKEYSRR